MQHMGKVRNASEKQIEYGKRIAQEARERRLLDGKWLCSKCGSHKNIEEYHDIKTKSGNAPSRCAECCLEATRKYHRKKAQEDAKEREQAKATRAVARRVILLAKMLTCAKCGETKPRGDWPIERGTERGSFPGKPRKYCCSFSKRSDAEVKEDVRRGSKVCSSCGERKGFESFSPNRQAEDGRQTTCKQCRRAKVGSGYWRGGRNGRREIIATRSDGSLTPELVGAMFAQAKTCPCCTGTMTRNEKVMDHIMPLKLGGAHSQQNTMVLCRSCNSIKAAKHPSDWLSMLNDDVAARMRAIYTEKGLDFG
jgi:5-methylcytosine-specific restriction endonuclease McrA